MLSIQIQFTVTPSRFTDIGFGEVVALEEEHCIVGLGACISEAITHVESRRVLSFSVFGIGFGGDVELSLADANEFELVQRNEALYFRAGGGNRKRVRVAKTGDSFPDRNGRTQSQRISFEPIRERVGVALAGHH